MTDSQRTLERELERLHPPRIPFEQLARRRERKQRNQRIAAGVLGIAVFALAAIGFVRLLGSEGTPASDPDSPFEGTWVSTSDADGGTQTMTVRVSDDGAVEITVSDTIATVCGGTPSTMTGTGRIEGGTALVIPAPVYTCDDGSEPEALSGPPLQEQLRDLTFVLDPETQTLTDNLGGLWRREGADASPEPPLSGGMWPQTTLEQVREAQELADAGDPNYTWQVDPQLASDANLYPWESEIVGRFLREELGWEDWGIGMSGVFAGAPGGPYPRGHADPLRAGPDEPPVPVYARRRQRMRADDRRLPVRDVEDRPGTARAPRPFRGLGRDPMGDAAARRAALLLRPPVSALRFEAGRAGGAALRRRGHRAAGGVPRSPGGWRGGRAVRASPPGRVR